MYKRQDTSNAGNSTNTTENSADATDTAQNTADKTVYKVGIEMCIRDRVSVILTGTVLIAKGSVDVSDLVTFMLYISVFTDPVRTLIDFTEQFQNGYTGFERFQEILAICPDIEDKKDAVELKDVKGDITFENVSFQYEENTEKVLNHISLNVPAGAYMALVGSSGAGKSTLCSLIPRFYDVTGGARCV